MNIILGYLRKPFPYSHKKWLAVLVPSVWVFFICMVLQPIGLAVISHTIQVGCIITIAAAIISFIVVYLFPLIFRRYHDPERWTVGKHFSVGLTIIVILGPVYAFIFSYISQEIDFIIKIPNSFKHLAFWYMLVLSVGFFPTIFIYFVTKATWLETRLYHIVREEEKESNTEEIPEIICFRGTTKELLEVLAKDFLYAEVSGNYVKISYIENGEVRQSSLRATLSQVIDSLEEYPQIIRCHRAFIVNISNVLKARGTTKAYCLTLKGTKAEVPVSRSYTKTIKEYLTI